MTAAVFAISVALLALEILLLRFFSVQHFSHFAYAVISIAMLGGGASGTALVLLRDRVRGRERRAFIWTAAAFTALLVACPIAAHRLPFEPTALAWSAKAWRALLLVALVLALPFFAGTAAVILAMLARPAHTPALYAANLAGSGGGALLALALLGVPPPWTPRVSPFKALPQIESYAGAQRLGERWSPLGWVVAVGTPAFHHAPGLSLAFRAGLPPQVAILVDGELAGGATRSDADDAAYLDWLPSAAAYRVVEPRRVLVIGSGPGLEVSIALAHGARRVVAVELNPDIVALTRQVLDSASDVYRDPRVELAIADARSFAARTPERFDLIVLAPAEAFGTAAAGLHALAEDYLSTVQALRSYLSRLAPGGALAMTRWVRAPPRDGVKMILTAGAALRASGDTSVSAHLVCLRGWATATVLVKPRGFGPDDLSRLRGFAASRLLDVDWLAGPPPGEAPVFNRVDRPMAREAAMATARGPDSASALAARYGFDVRPATDDRPYFAHFIRLGTLRRLLSLGAASWLPFAEWGYVAVLATLLQGALVAAILMIVPAAVLTARRPHGGTPLPVIAAYFGAIGLGYLLVEMALIQQLQRLLGHPVYAVTAALAGLLVCSGAGSLWSARLTSGWKPAASIAALIVVELVLAPVAVHGVQPMGLAARAATGLLLLAPPAVAMGVPFPVGVRALTAGRPGALAWAWAVNGFASVIAASVATLIAVEWGWRWVLVGGAACYAVAALAIWSAAPRRRSPRRARVEEVAPPPAAGVTATTRVGWPP
jgi:SAM-dependent methyltransferase